jgi:quinol monooxygenase YgiN
MEESSVMRMWITNKHNRKITSAMSESMVAFLSAATENGCLGSTFAEDDQRIIVYTRWSDEMRLEQFRSSKAYHALEGNIIESFVDAGFEIPGDILFNSTAKILFTN